MTLFSLILTVLSLTSVTQAQAATMACELNVGTDTYTTCNISSADGRMFREYRDEYGHLCQEECDSSDPDLQYRAAAGAIWGMKVSHGEVEEVDLGKVSGTHVSYECASDCKAEYTRAKKELIQRLNELVAVGVCKPHPIIHYDVK